MEHIGQRIAKARLLKNLNQKQLCLETGISESTLSRFEKGTRQPRTSSVVTLAKALDVSVEYLMGLTDEIDTYNDIEQSQSDLSHILKQMDELLNKDTVYLNGKEIDKNEVEKLVNLMKIGVSMIHK